MREKPKRTIRQQVTRLLTDYVFWRDLISTTLGGLAVVIIAFLWVVFMGYLKSPGFATSIYSFIQAIGLVLFPSIAVIVALWSLFNDRDKGKR